MKKDIILDMVEGLGKNIGKALAKVKEEPETTEIQNFSDKEVLVLLLRKLISDKKYNWRILKTALNVYKIIQNGCLKQSFLLYIILSNN